MKFKLLSLVLSVILTLGAICITAFAQENDSDIVILYENDAHCALEGYSKLSALKSELSEDYLHVGVVSSGDYIQGSSYGVLSRGEYIAKLINLVGYDAVALGNHEFDYRLPRLEELIGMMDTRAVCCNFQKIGEQGAYFDPYTIVSYGEVDIAYVGITTPSTIIKSAPSQFKNENGEYIYTFNQNNLYETVQNTIDKALLDGADYVIALSHIGDAEDTVNNDVIDVIDLITNTSGFDVVLDAHSHSVIEGRTVRDKSGEPVLLSSAGTKFEYIGKLTLSNGEFTTELIKTKEYDKTDPEIDSYIEGVYNDHSELGKRVVGESLVDLITHDEEGNRLVRKQETNLGNFCADALRYVVNADVGYINGGGLRAPIPKGEVTFNTLLDVFPHNNQVVLAEVTGQAIKDLLEMATRSWPEEGTFAHVSGITFSFNTSIPSSVVLNEYEQFAGVSGEYRVYDLKVFNRETGEYEPMDLDRRYTIASHNYYLIEHGSGMTMFEGAKILQNDGMLDVEALEYYLTEGLSGVISEEYRETDGRINYTDGEILSTDPTIVNKNAKVDATLTIMGIVSILLIASLILKKVIDHKPKNK